MKAPTMSTENDGPAPPGAPESVERRLHRLYDDDLSAQEREALERELAASPELGLKLEGLREVGAVVRAARTDEAPIDGEALWRAIEAELVAGGTSTSASEVESEGARRPRPVLRAIEGGAPPSRAPVEEPRTRRRRQIGIFVGALAIAAAALLMFYGQPPDPTQVADRTPVETTAPSAPTADDPTADDAVAALAPDYTEVLAVDFGTNVGTIFAVEGEGGQRYAVVWLDDVLKDEGEAPVVPSPEAPN